MDFLELLFQSSLPTEGASCFPATDIPNCASTKHSVVSNVDDQVQVTSHGSSSQNINGISTNHQTTCEGTESRDPKDDIQNQPEIVHQKIDNKPYVNYNDMPVSPAMRSRFNFLDRNVFPEPGEDLLPFLLPSFTSQSSCLEIKKRVRFSDSNQIFQTIHRQDIKPHEKRQAWYKKSELKDFKSNHDYREEEDHEKNDDCIDMINFDSFHDDHEDSIECNNYEDENSNTLNSSATDCYEGGEKDYDRDDRVVVNCAIKPMATSRVQNKSLSRCGIRKTLLEDDEKLSVDVLTDEFLECQRIFHRMKAVMSVLEEQERQREAMARRSNFVGSSSSRSWALQSAKMLDDEKIAQAYKAYITRSRQSLFASTLWTNRQKYKNKAMDTGIIRKGLEDNTWANDDTRT